ncbi:EP1-like glycoprotein 2 [Linum perenne]
MNKFNSIFFSSTVLALLSILVHSRTDIHIGYRLSLAVPEDYTPGFIGRALMMETEQPEPTFKVAISVESVDPGRFSCSLEVFLGDFKVWNSGHYSPFFTMDECVVELDEDGELQLRGNDNRLGWRSGTSAQGVERLVIMKNGNLVLVDSMERVKWQSFNFPTDVILWGQRLNVATRLASFPAANNSAAFYYTFEIHRKRIALHLISGKMNYTYWEFKPTMNRNVTFIKLASKALELYDDENQKIAQIQTDRTETIRFLSLSNRTGNLGIYVYSPEERKFSAAFQSLTTTCDLPSACKPYGICRSSTDSCSCIRLSNDELGCGGEENLGFCGGGGEEVEMVELSDVTTVLTDEDGKTNVSKEDCAKSCLEDCSCVAALYDSSSSSSGDGGGREIGECYVYGVAMGVKQAAEKRTLTYMVKVKKGSYGSGKSGLKRWVVVLVAVVDGIVVLCVVGGVGYLIRKRRKETDGAGQPGPGNNET